METSDARRPLVRYSESAARTLYDSLKRAGIDFAVLLPDSVLHGVNQLLLADPDIETVMCSREDEGVAIAMGAFWVGHRSVTLMEGSGIGMSGLMLARGLVQRSPTLIVASHNTVLGEQFDYHAAARLVIQPTLDALRIPYHVLRTVDEIPLVVREILVTMEGQRIPVAILVPRYICVGGQEGGSHDSP